MEQCVACGVKKPNSEMEINGWNEPLCTVCRIEIVSDAEQAFKNVCKYKGDED